MIFIELETEGLMLKKQYTYLVAGTKNCISIKVNLDRHWQGLEVFAVCYRDNKEYPYAITDGECFIADMAIISTSGEFKLKLLGTTADGNVVMTTNIVTVYVNDNKFSGAEGGELEYPTSDYLAEVLAGSRQAAEQAKYSADAAEESAKQAKLSAEQVSRDVELAGEYVKQIESDTTQVGKLAQQVTEQAEQVNRDAEQVASDKKSVETLAGQAVKAEGNAKTYMEQAGQIKADAQTMLDNASQAMAEVIGNAKTDLNGAVSKAKADIDVQGTEIIEQATAQADRAQSAADGIRDTADTLQVDNEHLKAELKQANRRISVLYDLGKGITHRYETDNDTAYSKDIPSGSKVMDVKMVGGKSVVGNQMITHDVNYVIANSSNSTFEQDGDNLTVTFGKSSSRCLVAKVLSIIGHKYYQSITLTMLAGAECGWQNYRGIPIYQKTKELNITANLEGVVVANENALAFIQLMGYPADDGTLAKCVINYKSARLIDLTQMFGAGNEPTLEQCREIFANESYPYNAGTLASADVTAVQVGDKVIQLPNSISLKSAGSVYDSLEFYEQDGKYYQKHTQRVGVVDLGTLSWSENGKVGTNIQYLTRGITDRAWTENGICDKFLVVDDYKVVNCITLRNYEVGIMLLSNITSTTDFIASLQGVLLYYELATPIVTVAEVDNRFDAVDCKAGDSITFVGNSDYHLPVPNEEEYLIALNEVTA